MEAPLLKPIKYEDYLKKVKASYNNSHKINILTEQQKEYIFSFFKKPPSHRPPEEVKNIAKLIEVKSNF